MSTTFWCPDAPTMRVPCPYCEAEGKRCDSYCRGYDEMSLAPEVTLSSGHAVLQLAVLGVEHEGEPYGKLTGSQLSDLLQRAMFVLATGKLAELVEAPSESTGPLGCRVVSLGLSCERLTSAMERLVDLFDYAARNRLAVHYG